MADWTVLRPGQINAAGSADALFLKVFAGEVLTTFETACVALPITMVRTITSGKSAQFPATGTVTAGYHTPGTEIVGQATKQNEKVINIDDLLVSAISIYNLDEAKSHFDVRTEYTKKVGYALAKQMDKNILQVAVLAAKTTTPTITGNPAGETIVAATVGTDKAVLKAKLKLAAQKFDEKDVPEEDRNAVISPALYYLLLEDTEVTSRDFSENHSIGNIRTGKVYGIYGLDLNKSNNLPSSNIAAVTGQNNTYSADFTNTKAVVFQKGAVGTVKLLDLATEMEYSVSRQSHLVVAKYSVGHGVLRPECSIELASA